MSDLAAVGQSVVRKDSWAKVTGAARYAGDVDRPGMLHMKIVFAGRPHARINGIDTTEACRYPGVVAVFTAEDVPVNISGLITQDQTVFCDRKVRHVGDQIGAVVAETAAQAAAAARLIRVDYEDLPVLDDPFQAMEEGQPLVHEDKLGNICHQIKVRRGDVAAAFAASDIVIAHEYFTPMQEHAYLEPEAGIGYIDEQGRVTVRTSGQNPHDDQRQICHSLNLPPEKVRVIYGTIGGAFGGREDISVQTALALAAWKLGRPVKITWSREESIRGHGKRHAITIRHKWGARADGTLLAAQVEIITDAGAYNYTSADVLNNFRYAAIGAYEIPNVWIDGYAVHTNNVPGAAFRGFGSPQSTFASEQQIGRLAEALGIDPVTIRQRNSVRDGSVLAVQSEIPAGVSLPLLLERCAEEMGARQENDGWIMPTVTATDSPHKRRGIGLAVAMKNSGFGWGFPEGSYARVELHGKAEIETAVVFSSAADVGQGVHSVIAQIAAQELALPLERVSVVTSDTAASGDAGAASASRLTMFAGQAVKHAATKALDEWLKEERPAVGGGRWLAPTTEQADPQTGAAFNAVSYSFAAQAVEVEIDLETGEVAVLSVIAAHDAGQPINPTQVDGQVEGGIVQAQGWAMSEDFTTTGGHIRTDRFSTYLIPTAMDAVPQIRSVYVDVPDLVGAYGARGMGEIGFVPLAPAVAAAIHDATGVWFDRLPLKPERIAMGLAEALS